METSNTNVVPSSAEAPRRQRSFYGPGKFKWLIYPDYWAPTWGPKPSLGIVFADDEFCAEREAYNRGLLTVNYTIRPVAVKIGAAKPRTTKV